VHNYDRRPGARATTGFVNKLDCSRLRRVTAIVRQGCRKALLITFVSVCRYVTANVGMTERWRAATQDVPDQLQFRPPHVISHVISICRRSDDMTSNMVTMNGDATYSVLSSSGNTYIVSLGDESTRTMPSCQCWNWQRTHLLCKHFGAVFSCFNIGWLHLPRFYTDMPVFTVDRECLSMDVSYPVKSTVKQADCSTNATSGNEEPTDAFDSRRTSPTGHAIRWDRRIRDQLCQLHGLTFLVESDEALRNAHSHLDTVLKDLQAACSTSGGLTVERPVGLKRKLTVPSVAARKVEKS
jgi:hypothetical protein